MTTDPQVIVCTTCPLPDCNENSPACPWHAADREAKRAYRATYNKRTPADQAVYMREYRRKNRDRLNAYQREYIHNLSPEQRALRRQRRREAYHRRRKQINNES